MYFSFLEGGAAIICGAPYFKTISDLAIAHKIGYIRVFSVEISVTNEMESKGLEARNGYDRFIDQSAHTAHDSARGISNKIEIVFKQIDLYLARDMIGFKDDA